MISRTFRNRSAMSAWSNAGCVAVQSTTVQPSVDTDCPNIEQVGRHQFGRQRLTLVEHDHAAGNVVELAAPAGLVREQALEKLHVGGDDDRHVPVLGPPSRRFATGLFFIFIAWWLGETVMLEDRWVVTLDSQRRAGSL